MIRLKLRFIPICIVSGAVEVELLEAVLEMRGQEVHFLRRFWALGRFQDRLCAGWRLLLNRFRLQNLDRWERGFQREFTGCCDTLLGQILCV